MTETLSEIDAAVDKDAPEVEALAPMIPSVGPELSMVAAMVQEIVDFLHKLFPGHGAPGVPGQEPIVPAPVTTAPGSSQAP